MATSTLLFGWCLPYSKCHAECKKEFTLDGRQYVCQCDCHKEASK